MALTVLDAGIVIAALAPEDVHHASAVPALEAITGRGDQLAIPASALAAVLVHPYRAGTGAVETVERFVDALPARVEPLTRPMARAAAEARARHGRSLPFPDALIVGTATVLHAEEILTTDRGWPAIGRPVTVVGE